MNTQCTQRCGRPPSKHRLSLRYRKQGSFFVGAAAVKADEGQPKDDARSSQRGAKQEKRKNTRTGAHHAENSMKNFLKIPQVACEGGTGPCSAFSTSTPKPGIGSSTLRTGYREINDDLVLGQIDSIFRVALHQINQSSPPAFCTQTSNQLRRRSPADRHRELTCPRASSALPRARRLPAAAVD